MLPRSAVRQIEASCMCPCSSLLCWLFRRPASSAVQCGRTAVRGHAAFPSLARRGEVTFWDSLPQAFPPSTMACEGVAGRLYVPSRRAHFTADDADCARVGVPVTVTERDSAGELLQEYALVAIRVSRSQPPCSARRSQRTPSFRTNWPSFLATPRGSNPRYAHNRLLPM